MIAGFDGSNAFIGRHAFTICASPCVGYLFRLLEGIGCLGRHRNSFGRASATSYGLPQGRATTGPAGQTIAQFGLAKSLPVQAALLAERCVENRCATYAGDRGLAGTAAKGLLQLLTGDLVGSNGNIRRCPPGPRVGRVLVEILRRMRIA